MKTEHPKKRLASILIALCFLSFVVRATGTEGVVVSRYELASRAGMDTLKSGGNAVDAAVATALALAVVEPWASGLGGGGFMVVYQAGQKKVHAIDFRETAPKSAHSELYVKAGKVQPDLSRTGALAVAVPGEVAGLVQAQKKLGKLPLSTVVEPAKRLAALGIPVDDDLRLLLSGRQSEIKKNAPFARLFLKEDGSIPSAGERLKQPDLARTLAAIASQGEAIFYRGWIANLMVSQLQAQGGILTQRDLENYSATWREPLLGRYRDNVVVGMPLPSAGGIAILQILKALEAYDLKALGHNSPTYLHLLAEMMKHAFSDRSRFLGDPKAVKIPPRLLFSEEHGASMRFRFSPSTSQPPASYGLSPSDSGTSHLNVVDSDGNAVACTLSINTSFGSKVVVEGAGFILNNEMDDFTSQPNVPNVYGLVGSEANAIESGRRPLSSMAPTLVLRQNRPFLVLGGSGGPRIVTAVLQTLLNVLDFKMDVRRAVEATRIHHQWMPNVLQVEKGLPPADLESLERRGHQMQERSSLARVQAIEIDGKKVTGVVDPRRN